MSVDARPVEEARLPTPSALEGQPTSDVTSEANGKEWRVISLSNDLWDKVKKAPAVILKRDL